MKFILKENNKQVELEKWMWHVVYIDDTELMQFDEEGFFHQFKEIDQNKVKFFEMINVEKPEVRYSIDKTEEVSQIFHFYRRARLNIYTDAEIHITIYCFGMKVRGISFYNFILPDGRLVVSTNRDIPLLS